MNLNKPEVSVCIPTYNSANYIGKAIDSVLAQDYDNYELIVLDNNSRDDTSLIVSGYKDQRIVYKRYNQTVSMGENWNRCLSLASGRYISLLHADDILLPGFLNEETKILRADPGIGYVFSAICLIDDKGKVISKDLISQEAYIIEGKKEYEKLILGNYIYCPSIMVRKECYSQLGNFNGRLQHYIDWDMWLRINLGGYQAAYLPAVLAGYRIHKGSASLSANIVGTPGEIMEWHAVVKESLLSKRFKKTFAGKEAEKIQDQAVLKIYLRCLKSIFFNYLPLFKIKHLMQSLKFMLFDMLGDKKLRLSPKAVFCLPALIGRKIVADRGASLD